MKDKTFWISRDKGTELGGEDSTRIFRWDSKPQWNKHYGFNSLGGPAIHYSIKGFKEIYGVTIKPGQRMKVREERRLRRGTK